MKKIVAGWIVLVLAGCCVTTEQHATLTDAFDRYIQRTEPLVQAEIARIGSATPADAALAQATQGWLDDAKTAVASHKELATR